MTLDDENLPDISSRKKKLYRLVAVSFGLLCVLQAALNISLRLTLPHYMHKGWVYFNSSFYYISSIKKTWQDSRNDCLQKGADLVIIDSKEEQEFTGKYKQIMWIGLSETEGVWRWVDGTLMKISFWRSGEPNNRLEGKEDCAEINTDGNSWNDILCGNQNSWICEKEMAL